MSYNKKNAKPVSISLTDSELETLNFIIDRFNIFSRKNDKKLRLNRSDAVRAMMNLLSSYEDDELFTFLSNER
ncbi:hypothetical protein BOO91_18855 [Vibrio navarrensis]|uniref:Uncharacterized protein n=1 Tax=Vibrio navarrensis TaxID=29495 RepID=A0AAJ4I9U2_9VIBR|nr:MULTISPECIES: hypothetical protein [Vibrio]KJR30104.1 hypothetical protein UF06_09685 [Vibrio sp. S234-5]MBE3653318.1 hypothetical protein [Vibrio navarrensis]MBE3658997.1 hypothetical protein [Vibrio navarrensis]MBE3662996.1 hypothetical protein [Vibrio navarrensis]MBE3671224.1 hypothetical protein [Vibrio navarrensis]